jgi:hypothetical protein
MIKRIVSAIVLSALCFLLLVLVGCVTTGGKNLNTSALTQDVSTKAEAIEALGDPDQEVTLPDGGSVCTWVSVRKSENLFLGALTDRAMDNTAQRDANSTTGKEISTVQITFSAKGILKTITKSRTGHVAE